MATMPDLNRLQTDLSRRYPEAWVRHHLESFNAAYFAAFDESDVDRHLGLMVELGADRLVAVAPRPAGPDEWWLDVVGYDCFQFLSTLCNLLAVRGLSILDGQVFTSRPPLDPPAHGTRPGARRGRPPRPAAPRGPDRRRKVVDVFRVRRETGAPGAPDWDDFRVELTALARLLHEGRSEEVHHRLIGRAVAALARHRSTDGPLEPLDLTIEPDGSDFATVVHVEAPDSFAFLYLTTSALALCGIVVLQADLRTLGNRVDDTLWVTDRFGQKITAESKLRELRLSLILIEHFSSRLPRATDPEAALVHFSRFAADTMARPDWAREFAALDRPAVLDALVRVLGESDFLWEDYLHAQPENVLPMIGDPAEWSRRRGPAELAAELAGALAAARSFEERCRAVGRFKDREIFRADVRSILGITSLDQFAAELSDLAEVLLCAAHQVVTEELGPAAPRRPDGRGAPSAVCALGKCGGRELGFASDLEVILVYADRGMVEGPGLMSPMDYFDRFVGLLHTVLAGRRDGTFELDFRLRPYGRGGPPATSLTAFINYYRVGGPAWSYERQALIKLRAVAGDPEFGREVEALRDRYVYGPEPFDLVGYRQMRRLQVEQLVRPGTVNAKFSPGALVDIEYFVQALQIAHGRREPRLRSPNTLRALAALGAAGRLSPDQVESLRAGYEFFRVLIDSLRVVHGHAKDLTVPAAGSEEFVLLARRMHRADPAGLLAELDRRLRATRALADCLGEFLGAADGGDF